MSFVKLGTVYSFPITSEHASAIRLAQRQHRGRVDEVWNALVRVEGVFNLQNLATTDRGGGYAYEFYLSAEFDTDEVRAEIAAIINMQRLPNV